MNSDTCPNCHSENVEDAGWTPMEGSVVECDDCRHVWHPDEDGPSDDAWIHAAYERQAGPNPAHVTDVMLTLSGR